MVTVAVSGGTGKLGRAIVEALRDTTNHSVLVLTRGSNDQLSRELGVPIIPVDYSDVDSLSKVLDENGIDTVISTILFADTAASESQQNLIEAAVKASSTKRLIPSEFGIPYNESHGAVFPPIKGKIEGAQRLKNSGLEYTLISNGLFMDYYGAPKVKSYLQPLAFAVDLANNAAAIPGSGDVPVVFTHTFDVAKYVAALTSSKDWPEQSIIIGDKLTWNELIALAEATKGVKFDVKYDSEDKLKTFQVTELPAHRHAYQDMPKEKLQYALAVYGKWAAAGDLNLPDTDILNTRYPEIKPLSFKELLQRAWKA